MISRTGPAVADAWTKVLLPPSRAMSSRVSEVICTRVKGKGEHVLSNVQQSQRGQLRNGESERHLEQ
jgi:hypothetical protein